MAFSEKRRDGVFRKTDGHCHVCRAKLARKNYGAVGTRGAWEIDHSKPQAKGGSHRLQNLMPACIPCNRRKGAASTRSSRAENGFKRAPLSAAQKDDNAWLGGLIGAVGGRIVLASLGPLGILAGVVIGAAIGHSIEPE